jgi:hypothetical protein
VFRASFEAPKQIDSGSVNLVFSCIDDHGWIYLNGRKIGETHSFATRHAFGVTTLLKPGTNVLAVVVDNEGGPGGLSQGVFLQPPAQEGKPVALTEIAIESTGTGERWWEPAFDDSSWETARVGAAQTLAEDNPPLLIWYRMHFAVPKASAKVWAPWKIRLDATGNGFLYLNGKPLGRYWEIGPQRDFFLPDCWLNIGDGKENVLTMCLRATDQPPQIRAAQLSVYADQAELRP